MVAPSFTQMSSLLVFLLVVALVGLALTALGWLGEVRARREEHGRRYRRRHRRR